MGTLYKVGASIACGGFCAMIMYLIIAKFARRMQALHAAEQDNREAAASAAENTDIKSRLRHADRTLAFDPSSKESKKIRMICGALALGAAVAVTGRLMFGIICGGGVYALIGTIYKKKIEMKKKVFEDQLIEALGMITNSVRAGQSLMQAIDNMVRETRPPISLEFGEAVRQVQLGVPIEEALTAITLRNPSKDLRIAVTSMNLAKETGGNIGAILTQLTATMAERRKIQGKITALTAQGKASGLVMSVVPFILLGVLYVMEPQMVGLLFTSTLGNIILSLVVVMIWLASIVIGKIVDIDI